MGIVTTAVVGIGVVISVLSIAILLLSISLLMQKNREKISSLVLLGYSPYEVAGYYIRVVAMVNITILVISSIALLMIRKAWSATLAEMGMNGGSPALSLLTGAAIMAAVTVVNILYIRRSTLRC